MDVTTVRAWIDRGRAVGDRRERDHLTQLDAAIGDADHGINLDRGFHGGGRAARRLEEPRRRPARC